MISSMKKLALVLLCAAVLGCAGKRQLADCSGSEDCYLRGNELFMNNDIGKAIPYFWQSIRVGAIPTAGDAPYIRYHKWGDWSMAAMEKYCIALMKLEKYYDSLDCFHILAMDGTGVYIGEIYDTLGIKGQNYLTADRYKNEIKDFQDNLVSEIWGE
jgi:hypothetical protein